jgi:hypothetical protein
MRTPRVRTLNPLSSSRSSLISPSISTPDKTNVIWVRHCFACHNATKNPMRKTHVEPFCRKEGIEQSIKYGYNFYNFLIKRHRKVENVNIYCSVLPRAMETGKLISYGMNLAMNDHKVKKDYLGARDIYRTDFHIETGALKDTTRMVNIGTVNSSTKNRSDCHTGYLNNLYGKLDDQCLKINISEIIGRPEGKTKFKYDDTLYGLWKEKVLPTLDSGDKTINLVVSHSNFFKMNVPYARDLPHHVDNLGSFWIRYGKSGSESDDIIPRSTINLRKSKKNIKEEISNVISMSTKHNIANCKYTRKYIKSSCEHNFIDLK